MDFAQFGPVTTEPLSRIQRISGPRLHASWVNIPHVTQFDEADITELEQLRGSLKDKAQAAGVKLTPLAFIMRACVKALQEFPRFNSALDPSGANLIVRQYVNMGFAADTPQGLVVPVVKDASRKDIYELARQLGAALREGPRRQAPAAQTCRAAASRSRAWAASVARPSPRSSTRLRWRSSASRAPACAGVYKEGSFVPRLMLPLSLSYDHRVIDGAMAARFTTFPGTDARRAARA